MNYGRPKQKKASIIIPAFNVENLVGTCIDSVLAQSCPSWEVVVIDDGSTDGTWSVLERYASLDSRIRIFRQENRGLSVTRNKGVELSTGDFLIFLDSDDWIQSDLVADALNAFMNTKPDVVIIQCAKYYETKNSWARGTDDFYWRRLEKKLDRVERFREAPEILALYPLAQLKVLSRRYFVENGLRFIDGLKYEDNPFHMMLYCLNPKCSVLPRSYYAWRQGRSGQITAKAHTQDCEVVIEKMMASADQLNLRELPFFLVAVIRLICSVAQRITNATARQEFVYSADRIVRGAFDTSEIVNAIRQAAIAQKLHMGDELLILTFFQKPALLSVLLGSSLNRLFSSIAIVFYATRIRSSGSRTRFVAKFLRNFRSLLNYSKGIGERQPQKFG